MTRILVRILAASALTAAVAATAACRDDNPAKAVGTASVGSVDVEQLDRMIAAGGCQVLDANGAPARQRMGIIPGATLLTDHERYALDELPADRARTLVFYCANEHCGASHAAAARAVLAGYTDVHVLPAGIAGWRNAGKSTRAL